MNILMYLGVGIFLAGTVQQYILKPKKGSGDNNDKKDDEAASKKVDIADPLKSADAPKT